MKTQTNNTIKLKEIENKLREVFNKGYGGTIELKINGECYEVLKE